MSEKTRGRHSGLLRRYIEVLATSPGAYFRLRDCDAQVRLFIAAAAACNDLDPDFGEQEYQAMAEVGVILYDAVAFYKHRAEGEVSNLYAYCGQDLQFRQAAYASARATLWALETQWFHSVQGRCAINLLKNLPLIHMAMSRYRFVEDGLSIGRPETSDIVRDARANVKLWYRSDTETVGTTPVHDVDGQAIESVRHMLFDDLAQVLQATALCPQCVRRETYGAAAEGQFGGVVLCDDCRRAWRAYVDSSWHRHASALSLPS